MLPLADWAFMSEQILADVPSEAELHENLNVFLFRSGTAYPERFQVETTSRCNLKCPNCRRTTDFPDAADSQSNELLSKIGSLLAHTDQIAISGWGESLMGRSLEQLLDMSREAKVTVSITSNGTLLTEKKCRTLIEKGVGAVTVSIDAGTPEGYARLRPGGVPFERVIDGLNRLVEMREEMQSEIPHLGLAMVYYDDSAEELLPLLRVMADKLPKITSLVLQILYFSDFSAEAKSYRLSARSIQILEQARRLARKLKIQLSVDIPAQMDLDAGQMAQAFEKFVSIPSVEEIRQKQLVPTCNSAWENPFIDAQGNVYPCCIYPESFGNLNSSTFEEIWRGEKFRQMRLGLHAGSPSEHCRNCRKTLWYPNSTPTEAPARVQLGDPGFIGMGWYGPETTRWGTPFRWSRDQSDVFLGNSGQRILFFEAAALPGGQELEVSMNGNPVATIEIAEKWAVYTVPIPHYTEKTLQIGLRSARPQKNPDDADAWWPRRLLGVSMSQIGLCVSPDQIQRMNPTTFSAKLQRTARHKLKSLLAKV